MRGIVQTLSVITLIASVPSARAAILWGQTRPLSPWFEESPAALPPHTSTSAASSFDLTHTREVTDRAPLAIPSFVAAPTPWLIDTLSQNLAPVRASARWTRVNIDADLPRPTPPVGRPDTAFNDFDATKRVGVLFEGDVERSGTTLARFIPAPGSITPWLAGMTPLMARRRR